MAGSHCRRAVSLLRLPSTTHTRHDVTCCATVLRALHRAARLERNWSLLSDSAVRCCTGALCGMPGPTRRRPRPWTGYVCGSPRLLCRKRLSRQRHALLPVSRPVTVELKHSQPSTGQALCSTFSGIRPEIPPCRCVRGLGRRRASLRCVVGYGGQMFYLRPPCHASRDPRLTRRYGARDAGARWRRQRGRRC